MTEQHNPFAPPVTDDVAPTEIGPFTGRDDEVVQALRRLNEHASDPARREADRKLAGPRVRIVATLPLLATAIPLTLIAGGFEPAIGALMVFVLVPWIPVALYRDLWIASRRRTLGPLETLRAVWRAAKVGRAGYFQASLCPTAREVELTPPADAPGKGPPRRYALDDPRQVKRYLGRWAIASVWRSRSLVVRDMAVTERDHDAALVHSTVEIVAWPWWIGPLALALLVALVAIGIALEEPWAVVLCWAPGVLVGGLLYVFTRDRRELQVDKVMLRAEAGLWYLLRADLER